MFDLLFFLLHRCLLVRDPRFGLSNKKTMHTIGLLNLIDAIIDTLHTDKHFTFLCNNNEKLNYPYIVYTVFTPYINNILCILVSFYNYC